jgi:hypothetical protein
MEYVTRLHRNPHCQTDRALCPEKVRPESRGQGKHSYFLEGGKSKLLLSVFQTNFIMLFWGFKLASSETTDYKEV